MTVGLLTSIRLSLALVTLVIAPTVTAANFPPALDPRGLISDGQPVSDEALLRPLIGKLASNRINGLLNPSNLWPREQAPICAVNYSTCAGTEFCCPDGGVCCPVGTCCNAGAYCTTVGDIQGCCRVGHTCSRMINECADEGQRRCPNENFCCAAGDTCHRDANGYPRCSSSGTSAKGSTPIIPALTVLLSLLYTWGPCSVIDIV